MMAWHKLNLFKALTVLVGLLLISVQLAAAHGGGTPRLTNTPIGPYWVTVWTEGETLRVGTLHLTIAVTEPGEEAAAEAGPPVLGAEVQLVANPPQGNSKSLIGQANHDQSVNKLLYETDLDLDQAGVWQFQLLVSTPAGQGETSFELNILPASSPTWPLVLGIGLVLAISVWFIQRQNRKQPFPAS